MLITGRLRFAALLSTALALQLLGGHYQIAFLTWLLGGAFVMFRLARPRVPLAPPVSSSITLLKEEHWQSQWHTRPTAALLVIVIAFLAGVAVAAPQLLASWELKGHSQRAIVGVDHDPAYGHIPPGYLTQIVAPWFWYDATLDLDTALQRLPLGQIAAGTNKVEAHCYFGLAPTLLLLLGGALALRRRAIRAGDIFWFCVIVASLVYATGWLMPVLKMIPGFNFFRGPGRASVLTTFAVAMLVGRLLEAWLARVSSLGLRRGLILGMFTLTIFDLWFTPTTVSYALAVDHPPIAFREDSPLRKLLLNSPRTVRLYAPGANVPNLLGVASTPVYLGFGPREYFAPEYTLPETDPPDFHTITPKRWQWLLDAGVTHILSFQPMELPGGSELTWFGLDPMLNRAWARAEPFYLYELKYPAGRVRYESKYGHDHHTFGIKKYTAHHISIKGSAQTPGQLILTDLADPNWVVSVDGESVVAKTSGMYRSVEVPAGMHEVVWSYRPQSVYWGGVVSVGVLILLVVMGWSRRRAW